MVPLLWLLELLPPLVYADELPDELPDDTAGLLYEEPEPVVAEGFPDTVWFPAAIAEFCLETAALLTAELPPDDFDAVTLLRDELLEPMVPRLTLLLEPEPLRTVVLPESVNTLPSLWVSYRGPYHVLLEKWPPCPCPGPPWM